MRINNPLSASYNYALSQVFSPSFLKRINDPSHQENIRALLNECNIYTCNERWDFNKALESTYKYLKSNYRCEYVYMNEIANQLLLKFHNDNSATLLKEVNSDSSIADIVIINGDTVAYEIKTELDSFDRLPTQIESYQILYDYLYIVTHVDAVDALRKKIGDNIGIIVLDTDGVLMTIQKASSNKDMFNPSKAGLIIRQSELVSAYEKYIGKIPKMGSALIYNFCYKWYLSLDKITAHIIFSEALKSRKPSSHQFELIKKVNPSLKMLFLGKELSKKYCLSTMDRLGIFG